MTRQLLDGNGLLLNDQQQIGNIDIINR